MKFTKCAIIKDIYKGDSYYIQRNNLIGTKICYSEIKKSRNEGYYSVNGFVCKTEKKSKKFQNTHFFYAVKLEDISKSECKKCKYRLKCITN